MYGSVASETCLRVSLINRDDAPVAMFASLAKPLGQAKGSWTHIDELVECRQSDCSRPNTCASPLLIESRMDDIPSQPVLGSVSSVVQ